MTRDSPTPPVHYMAAGKNLSRKSLTLRGFFMEIDFERETLLSLAQAAKRIPGRPSLRTLWRWVHVGVDGHRLETIKCGARRFTSEEAIRRFIECGTRASRPNPTSDSRREREIARAEAELAGAGF